MLALCYPNARFDNKELLQKNSALKIGVWTQCIKFVEGALVSFKNTEKIQ